jgi:tRNA (guanine37-N1)-methyltransferase
MRFDVLTLFPDMFQGYVGQSLLKQAIAKELVDVRLHNIRDWADDKHSKVDDRPFGGGPGMVLKADRIVPCVEDVQQQGVAPGHLVMLTPQGRPLRQTVVEELATQHDRIVLLCGRYEGFDERIRVLLKPDEISLGDFILNGGEVAAMAIIDAVMRLQPGALGHELSSEDDSFSSANRLLEFEQYTRPREYRGLTVPEVLLNGNHQEIAQWREQNSRERTAKRRPDLLDERNEVIEDE